MKILLTLGLVLALSATAFSDAGFDFTTPGAITLNINNAGNINTYDYDADLGIITSLKLNGAKLFTYENSGGNICSGTLYYRIYLTGASPGSFSSFAVTSQSSHPYSVTAQPTTWNSASSDEHLFSVTGKNITLLDANSTAGKYTAEFYFEATGEDFTSGCTQTYTEDGWGMYYSFTMTMPYVSIATGTLDDPNIWNPTRTSPSSGDYLYVSNGDTVTVDTATTISHLQIANGGVFTSAGYLTKLTVSDTFYNDGVFIADSSLFVLGNNAHLDGSTTTTFFQFDLAGSGTNNWSPVITDKLIISSSSAYLMGGANPSSTCDLYYNTGSTFTAMGEWNGNNVRSLTVASGTTLDISSISASTIFTGSILINGVLTGSSSDTYTIGGNFQVPGTYSVSGLSVKFNGSTTQTISGPDQDSTFNFSNMEIDNSNPSTAQVEMSVNVYAENGVTLTSGILKLGNCNLTIGDMGGISGSLSSSAMISAEGSGYIRQKLTFTSTILFPTGDITGTREYAPITVDLTSGTPGGNGYIAVNSTNSKHGSNTSSSHYLNRSWNVAVNDISGPSFDIVATYADGDIVGTESSIYGGRFVSPNWTQGNAVNTSQNSMSFSSLSASMDFSGGESGALPVEWLYVNTLKESENSVLISWATASETNNDFFEVEFSSGEDEWQVIGQISAVGNSLSTSEYAFHHDLLEHLTKAYYRIKQVDADGKFTYSQISDVSWEMSEDMVQFKNPMALGENISISLDRFEDITEITLIDPLGRIIWSIEDLQESTVEVQARKIEIAGIYTLVVNGLHVEHQKLLVL